MLRQLGSAGPWPPSQREGPGSAGLYLQPDSPVAWLLDALDDPQVTVNYFGRSPAAGPGRMLIPSPMPEGLTIGSDNVLLTPVGLDIVTNSAGTVEARFLVDPHTFTAAAAQDLGTGSRPSWRPRRG